jgi:gamma-glutamyl-gamma-aminobutyrate hydrolase PuuD
MVTTTVPEDQPTPDLVALRIQLYLDAMARHGAIPLALNARSSPADRERAWAAMDGLLLTGGGDIDPRRYSRPNDGSRGIEPDRDELEARAWAEADARQVPVLGICRGLQAINVFSGGSLLQDDDGHAGAGWGSGPPAIHPLRLVGGTLLARSLGDPETLEVNAYHHQGILEGDLAPALVAAAWADSSAGPLIEGLEAPGERFVVGVQCHPERTESTPPAFEGLFAAFVRAASTTRTAAASRAGTPS